MKKYIVYDFDNTIYNGDSSIDFFLFCCRRHPSCLKILPGFLISALRYRCGQKTKEEMKSSYFRFLSYIPHLENELETFSEIHICRIKSFYRNKNHEQDIIISASPEFLLKPICKLLGVPVLIASEVDCKTGEFLGKNCYGEEKWNRLCQMFGESVEIEQFYSDSDEDLPLARRAKKAWKVHKSDITEWHSIS